MPAPETRRIKDHLATHGTGIGLIDLLADQLRLYHDRHGHKGQGKDPRQCNACDLLRAYDTITTKRESHTQ